LPKRCFLPTFDDGFRETHDVIAPILASFGVDGVFFINTAVLDNRELLGEQKKCLVIGALGSQGNSPARREVSQALAKVGFEGQGLTYSIRSLTYRQRHILDTLEAILECDFKAYAAKVRPYLTTAQTVTLTKMGFSIGAHSVDHPLYSELSLEEQLAQTQGCFDYLWKHFKYRCQTFAFPYMDTGISPDFFQRIYADGRLKVSFGSDGMHRHFFPRNLERFKMEYPDLNALQIAAREFYLAAMRKPSWNAT
jgi:peptidoglycan/xylan/chitin deacetylase (PgdA/CDA1 family)